MKLFSEEYGFAKKELQINSVSQKIRNRVWNYYYENESQQLSALGKKARDTFKGKTSVDKKIADRLGYQLHDLSYISKIRSFVLESKEWYNIYDFIEIYLENVNYEKEQKAKDLNKILEEENAGYRIVDYKVVPIIDENEIDEIEGVIKSPYESVSVHTKKALDLLSNRTNPDYENSIKESISAVESLCCIITGETGKNATLNKTIKKLKGKGVYIHGALESAFISLYGYTSDESGVRHGGKDTAEVTFEDAKYMLVTCSAFVNYLITKWEKIK